MASIQGQMSKCIMSHDDKITDKSKNVRDENRIRLGTWNISSLTRKAMESA